ncbi:MAG: two-component system response regulator [Firmicutes bacterium HGW-Firmicutes-15]|nr:MAG: two-component system response regulator [Firmicutes bacterium HGW-Firmicutes-15]
MYKVLIVDDDKNILATFRRLLHNHFIVATAENGLEGITALKNEGPFAVVVSDFRMPGMNGIEFLSKARQIAPETIQIMLSGQADMQTTIDLINEGHIYRFLTKPYKAEHFLNALKGGSEQYRLSAIARELEQKKIQLESLQKTVAGVINMLVSITEKRDPYTAGHQARVAEITGAIAVELSLSEGQVQGIKMAATIHDVGKICIPAEILSKPGLITEAENNLVKTHVQIGYDILKTVEFPWPIADIVYQHHERMDGSGYPLGLAGDKILLEARILAVADVVEAMAGYRPYRPAFTMEDALNEISQNRGILYDAEVVDACLKTFQGKGFKPMIRN